MSKVCECNFDNKDPNDPGYSMTEVDLVAKTGASIRKNHETGKYEIFDIQTGNVHYKYRDLDRAVNTAKDMGDEHIEYGHGNIGCDRRRA